jgi:hypothetical protein
MTYDLLSITANDVAPDGLVLHADYAAMRRSLQSCVSYTLLAESSGMEECYGKWLIQLEFEEGDGRVTALERFVHTHHGEEEVGLHFILIHQYGYYLHNHIEKGTHGR